MTTPLVITGTGRKILPTNIGDAEALISLYGTQTGFQFAFQWSPDGVNGWAPLTVKDAGTGLLVTGTIAPADLASAGWLVPCNKVFIAINVTAIGGGSANVTPISRPTTSPAPSNVTYITPTPGLTLVNANLTTAGAGTLTAAQIVGGVVTRSGPTAAFTDTTDTAAAIIAAITNPTVGQSWVLTIKNTTAFNGTLAGGSSVTLSGQLILPPNCTGRYLVTVASATTVTVQCLQLSENCPLPNDQFTSINVTTGSLAAGVVTGARIVNVLSTNAAPGAQLVRTAAQMLADIPNGVVGMSWRLFITNSGAGTFTLTTDAGATVTLTGTMTIPTNTTREFIVTINSATTATIQSVGTGTI